MKDILTVELRKLETEISLKEDAAKQSSSSENSVQPVKPPTSQSRIPTIDVKNYGTYIYIMILHKFILLYTSD